MGSVSYGLSLAWLFLRPAPYGAWFSILISQNMNPEDRLEILPQH